MLMKIIKKFLVEVILEKAEEKFLNFFTKVFTEKNVSYFSKIKDTVNKTMEKITVVYEYLEPLSHEISGKVSENDKKYLQDIADFVEKEFGLKINIQHLFELADMVDKGEWKRETSVDIIKQTLENMGIEVKESLIRTSLELAYQAFKTEKETK